MRAWVTGSNSLVGCHIVRELLAHDWQVTAMVRESSDVRSLKGLACKLVSGDVADPESLAHAAQGCDVVFHAAAVFSYWGHSAEAMYATAEAGTRNVIDAAVAAGAKRFVLTSSAACLGGTSEPVVATADGRPNAQRDPDYFLSKLKQEEVAFEYGASRGLEVVATQPTVVFGPHDYKPSASASTISGYLGAPLRITLEGGISPVHAADLAIAHRLVAEQGVDGRRYPVGGENLRWRAIHELLSELCGIGGPQVTANRVTGWIGGLFMELAAWLTGRPPFGTRELARQAGLYYWVSNDDVAALGYVPRDARQTFADALGWHLASGHIPEGVGRKLAPVAAVVDARGSFEVIPRN